MKKIFALVAAVFLSMSQPYANDCVLYSYTQEKSAYTPGFICSYVFDESIPFPTRLEFKARKQLASICYTPDMYLRVAIANEDGSWTWQDGYVWDSQAAGMTTSYKTFSVELPAGVRKIEFTTNVGATLQRFVKDLYVYKIAANEPSVDVLDFGNVLLGETVEKTFQLGYVNLSELQASLDDEQFSVEVQDVNVCNHGYQTVKVTFTPKSLGVSEATLKLDNGAQSSVSLRANVIRISTPDNFRIVERFDDALSLAWDEVDRAAYYQLRNNTKDAEYLVEETEYVLYDVAPQDEIQLSAVFNEQNISFPRLLMGNGMDETTDITEVEGEHVSVSAHDGCLTLSNLSDGDVYCISDINGHVYAKGVANADTLQVYLPVRGVCLVSVNGETLKVMM